jgi:diguanylate cyclase (GGDEF)-like protein
MRSWWSASASPSEPVDTAALLRRFVEASRRAEIIALVNTARTEGDVARIAVDELCEAFDAEVSFVVVTRPGYGPRETVGSVGLSDAQAAAVATDRLCTAALGAARAEVHQGSDLLGLGLRRLALSPWTAANGRQMVVGVGRLADEGFDPAELALLEAVTDGVGHGLERAWLGAERDRQIARQDALVRAAKLLPASLVPGEVLATLSREVAAALEADVVVVAFGGEHGEPRVVAGTRVPQETLGGPCGPPGGLCVEVARTGRPQVTQPFDEQPPVALRGVAPLRSGLAVPICPSGEDSRSRGVVLVASHAERWIEAADVELLGAFAELAGIAGRNAEDHAAAQRAATLDALTGCLNHGAFQDRLREEIGRAERAGGDLALALIDLDHFKAANDRFGHLAGDALLREVGEALRASVRVYDQVGRYGGDEFVLLLPAIDEATARSVVDRARCAVSRVRSPGGMAVSASAGLALWRPGEQATALIERADRTLLEAKRARPGRTPIPPRRREAAAEPGEDRERHRLARLAAAGGLATRLARLLDQRAIAETAMVELGMALGYERCVLVRQSEDGNLPVVAAAGPASGEDGDASPERVPRFAPTDAVRRSMLERRPALVATPANGGPGGTELAVPVHVGGALWGALSLRSGPGGTFDDHDAQLAQIVADHVGTALRTAQLYEELEETHLATAAALAAALESTDPAGATRARAVAELAERVGRRLGLVDGALRDLRLGGLLRNIGRSAIPEAILAKPGPLTGPEREVIRAHPAAAERILAPVPSLAGVRRIVRHEHERWDGGGYPDGLRGEEIPLGARIVAAADAYHAMRAERPYRRALDAAEARAELREHAGSQFDPAVVDVLLAVLDREPQVERA